MQHQIKPSENFKTKASLTIQAIIVFIIIYLLLLLAAIALTGFCAYIGIVIILFKPMAITFLVGIGLIIMGFLVLLFLIKFIFHKSKTDLSDLLLIKQSDAPSLFSVINEVAEEVGTNKPKNVYLSNEVNAYVFYDSSFWSMFLPIKKNLTIGVGLINSVTISEFKSIMAHEFGHFSQKSMKLGSYTYNVNKVIYNMLYDNDSYNNLKQKIAGWHNYVVFFANRATDIVGLIQKILKLLYNDINLNYMALSREMEFHADEIAASITGSAPMISGLLRIDLANDSYQTAINYYSNKIRESIKTSHFYSRHRFILTQLGKDDELKFIDGFPAIQKEDVNKYNRSKLVITNQWASHPSLIDRVEAIEKLNFPTQSFNNEPAISLISSELEVKMTDLIFASVTYDGPIHTDTIEEFSTNFTLSRSVYEFPKLFDGYYNAKNPELIDIISIEPEEQKISHLFSREMRNKIYSILSLSNDIELLSKISESGTDILNFDYDGQKYTITEANIVLEKIKLEKQTLAEDIKENDFKIYQHFLFLEQCAGEKGELKNLYTQFLYIDKDFDNRILISSKLESDLAFTQNSTPISEIVLRFDIVKKNSELEFKNSIKDMLATDAYSSILTEEEMSLLVNYINIEIEYFDGKKYDNDKLFQINSIIQLYKSLLSRTYFNQKKVLLDYFVALQEKKEQN